MDSNSLHQRLEDYEKLFEVVRTIGASLDIDEILQRIVNVTLELCNAQQCAITLFDPHSPAVAKTLIRERQSDDIHLDHFLNALMSGWTMTEKRPQTTNDLIAIFGEDQIKGKYADISSAMSIPMIWRGEIVGVINIITLDRRRTFGERELRLMEHLASQCAQFIMNARLHEDLFAETARLRRELQNKYAFHGIIGQSPQMQTVFELLERVIPTNARVLLEGESGTGKERIACVLHYNGPRKEAPFVAVDCGAIPANLLESELFGYVKGAFTGATRDKKGLFEEASGGTLFLDEIVNMPLEVQAKFLRAIQESEIRPVGALQVRKVDVRIIAAASGNLKAHVEAGKFRQDLYYRLNVVTVQLPPLRDRRQDILTLARHFLATLAQAYQKKAAVFDLDAIAYLEAYDWPGNVRELENSVERMVVLAKTEDESLSADLLPPDIRPFLSQQSSTENPDEEYEKTRLLLALTKHNWNQSSAARELRIHEKTVRYRMQKFGLRKP
ncbi:MAG: sigma-54-dependent Fis family transcriptional regulator [Ignavibacteriae bacterium]|nr:sigma-54-dependent Fis family transcriptional regulator [Ignavibacteriota bacterium]